MPRQWERGLRGMTDSRDFLDYPTAWAIQKEVGTELAHHERSSSVPGWCSLSGPAFLCDCGAVETEWKRRRG